MNTALGRTQTALWWACCANGRGRAHTLGWRWARWCCWRTRHWRSIGAPCGHWPRRLTKRARAARQAPPAAQRVSAPHHQSPPARWCGWHKCAGSHPTPHQQRLSAQRHRPKSHNAPRQNRPPPPSSPPPIRNRSPTPGLRPRARQSSPCWPKAPLPTPTAQRRARPSRCQATPLWRPSRRRSLQMRAHQHRIRHRPHTATLRPHQPKPACRPPPHNPHCCRATAGCATTCWGKPKA